MPLIQVDGPLMSLEQKRDLVSRLTRDVSEVTGIAANHIIVILRENPRDCVADGGVLICDLK